MQDYCSKPKENVNPHNPAHVDNKKSQIFLTFTPQAAINQIPIHFMTVGAKDNKGNCLVLCVVLEQFLVPALFGRNQSHWI